MKYIFFVILCLTFTISKAQPILKPTGTTIFGNDTITVLEIIEIPIVSRPFIDAIDEYKFNQLRRNIMSVYPYYSKTIQMIRIVQENTANMEKDKEKKNYKKDLEKQLDAEFRSQLENLTTTQGKILIEMIERQTGKPLHSTIKEARGSWEAFKWQMVAGRFGYDLKEGYIPSENTDMELLLHAILD